MTTSGESVQERINRWGDIHAHQSSEYLGREVAKLGEIIDWLQKRHDINGWCSCGHMERVHHAGGCTGLTGGGQGTLGQDGWAACRCAEYGPAPWSKETAHVSNREQVGQ